MKIRKGFVSNSSSSSFIMGIVNLGKEKPKDIADGLTVSTVKELRDRQWGEVNVYGEEEGYRLEIESFNYDRISCKATSEDDYIAYFEEFRGSDEDFSVYNDNGEWVEMDYNIGLDFFNNSELELYKEIKRLGGEVSYGAGRDG